MSITATTAPLFQPDEAQVEAVSDARLPVKPAYVSPVVERLGHWQVHTLDCTSDSLVIICQ